MKYSESFKAKMVQRMAGGRSANSLSEEVGVNQPTLSRWLREAGRLHAVKRRPEDETNAKTERRRPDEWRAGLLASPASTTAAPE
jgi:transposase-like protein